MYPNLEQTDIIEFVSDTKEMKYIKESERILLGSFCEELGYIYGCSDFFDKTLMPLLTDSIKNLLNSSISFTAVKRCTLTKELYNALVSSKDIEKVLTIRVFSETDTEVTCDILSNCMSLDSMEPKEFLTKDSDTFLHLLSKYMGYWSTISMYMETELCRNTGSHAIAKYVFPAVVSYLVSNYRTGFKETGYYNLCLNVHEYNSILRGLHSYRKSIRIIPVRTYTYGYRLEIGYIKE